MIRVHRVAWTSYYCPSELTGRIGEWVDGYNYYCYHEAIDNVTPSDKCQGTDLEILTRRETSKRKRSG